MNISKDVLCGDLKSLTNEEIVELIQETNEEIYWREIEKRTKKTYSYVIKEYVNNYYKDKMLEDIKVILKIGWIKAIKTYDRNKATSDFIPYCIFLMNQNYKMFARRITQEKSGNSVRDTSLSNILSDNNGEEKMIQGYIDNIMKYECVEYEQIELKLYINDILLKLKEYDYMLYYVIKKHFLDGLTQKDLGVQLNLSQSAISRYVKRGLSFLKKEILNLENNL